jgi:hypothetical protein
MKIKMYVSTCFGVTCVAVALLAGLAGSANAAVGFNVTPAAVSNTYNGQITLTVTGLTTGSTVVIQKFLDLNTNGVINTSDWLVQQFRITDGQPGMVIGGVTNFNVPGDLNSTSGVITATLNFSNGDVMQKVAGKYLFKASGNFTPPITNVFTVTNFPFAQKFTGNVVSNGTSTTLSNAVVLLFPPPLTGQSGPSGSPRAGAVANNSGSYTIPAPSGTYLLASFRSNFLANFAAPPIITLGASQTVTTNLTLTNTTSSVSGKVADAANANIGLPGVLVIAEATNGLMGVGFTDTNGNFIVRVRSGQWSVHPDDISLIVHGYLGMEDGTNVSAGAVVTNGVPKATALVYGTVKDNLGNPLPGIDVYVNDSPGSGWYQTDGYTDTNGNYVAGVVGGSDYWWVEIEPDNGVLGYVFSESQLGGTIAGGTAVLQDFTGILATNHITGNVKFNGANVVGVSVTAIQNIGGTIYKTLYTTTDSSGNYSLNVFNGTWTVSLYCSGDDDDSLDSILGSGNYVCPGEQAATINNNDATNNFTVPACGSVIINTASLPVGEVNVEYYQTLDASSCNPPFTWAVTNGSLPSELTLASNGELAGTPAGSGTFNFTVRAVDSNSKTNSKALSLTINPAVQVTTTTLSNGTNGAAYSQQLQASGGVPFGGASPYTWSWYADPDDLPPNLTLSTNGLLSGVPVTVGTFSFTIGANDALGANSERGFSLTIVNTNSSYPPLTAGTGGGQVIVCWPLSWGTNYTLEMTTNLETGPWVPATSGVPMAAFTFTNNLPAAFFRVR